MLCIRPMCTYLSMSLLAVLAVTAVARLCLARDLLQQSISPNVRVTVDVSRTHPMPESLYGIFFEEIQHAGEGGLYAELVQDRSFSGLAYTQAFLDSDAQDLVLGPSAFQGPTLGLHPSLHAQQEALRASSGDGSGTALLQQLAQHTARRELGATSQPVSWRPLGSANLTLTKHFPLSGGSRVAMHLGTSSAVGGGGITNTGFWGIPVRQGGRYELSVYLRHPGSCQDAAQSVEVALESEDGQHTYASMVISDVGSDWAKHTATLVSDSTDPAARLAIRLRGGGVLLDMVSLFPADNGAEGRASPFRADLLALLKGLHPKFLRFPGGCYVEGVTMRNAFLWKPSVGPLEERTGHWNGPWEYWSTDGLGLYEYMLLSEELGAEPIWVINNGISHQESVPASQIQPMVEDALDSIEFITGPPDSRWGGLRARMGHPEPWALTYMGIGNEDCGKPFYIENYNAFFSAIKAVHPHMRLIANCHMGLDAPTELWDWHWYTDPDSMFNGRYTFDSMSVAHDARVFASEYAVFDWGIKTIPRGNIQGAVAEAAFMTGMERNSEVVQLAAYAPLLAHVSHVGALCPTNLVIYDNHRAFGNPSYHVQALFAQHAGVRWAHTEVDSRSACDNGVAASASCADANCSRLSLKLVNYEGFPQTVALDVLGLEEDEGMLAGDANVTTLAGAGPYVTNSFESPLEISPRTVVLQGGISARTALELPAFSVTIIATSPGKGDMALPSAAGAAAAAAA